MKYNRIRILKKIQRRWKYIKWIKRKKYRLKKENELHYKNKLKKMVMNLFQHYRLDFVSDFENILLCWFLWIILWKSDFKESKIDDFEQWVNFENIIFLYKEKMQTTFIKAAEIINKYKNEIEHDSVVLYLDNENKRENNFE